MCIVFCYLFTLWRAFINHENNKNSFVWLFEILRRFQALFGKYISAVGPPNRLSRISKQWSPISPQVTVYESHIILNQRSQTNDHRLSVRKQSSGRNNASPEDRTSDPWITNPMLYTFWVNLADNENQNQAYLYILVLKQTNRSTPQNIKNRG